MTKYHSLIDHLRGISIGCILVAVAQNFKLPTDRGTLVIAAMITLMIAISIQQIEE